MTWLASLNSQVAVLRCGTSSLAQGGDWAYKWRTMYATDRYTVVWYFPPRIKGETLLCSLSQPVVFRAVDRPRLGRTYRLPNSRALAARMTIALGVCVWLHLDGATPTSFDRTMSLTVKSGFERICLLDDGNNLQPCENLACVFQLVMIVLC